MTETVQGRRTERGGAELYAALDLGTNNCRLLVARPAESGFRIVDSFSRVVRLGEGLSRTGRLAEDAIARTLASLAICAEKLARRRVRHARHVATEACRRAANCAEFLDRVERATGIALEIISAREEAALAVAGCGPLIDRDRPRAILFDIGGGSTEIAWIETAPEPRILDVISLPTGVSDLAERYGGREVRRDTYEAMAAEIAERLMPFETRHAIAAEVEAGRVQMLGTSGTVTTLAGLHMDLPRYDRVRVDGCHLALDDAWRVADRLLAMSYEERARHPCVLDARAEFVLPGAAILAGICRLWPVGRLRVADRGLRDGILLGLMERRR